MVERWTISLSIVPAPTTLRVTIDLEPRPESAGSGRRFLQETLASWDCPEDMIEQAIRVGAELLTYAILHAGTPFTVEVSYAEGVARVSVRDYSPAMAAVRRHRLDATTGRGLDLVGALSRRWAVAAWRSAREKRWPVPPSSRGWEKKRRSTMSTVSRYGRSTSGRAWWYPCKRAARPSAC